MAEVFHLCLSYISESAHESSELFETRVTTNYPVDQPRTNKEDQSVDITDVSSELRDHPSLEIFSGINNAMERRLSTMSLPDKEYNKARSVKSNHGFERGESSRNDCFSYRLPENFDVKKDFDGENFERTECPRPSQTNRAASISQTTTYRDLGDEDDVELDVFIRRALGLSLADVRLSDEEIPKPGKDKKPVRPSVIDVSLFGEKLDRNGEANRSIDKGKQPLRSVLIQALSPYSAPIEHHDNARLALWTQVNPRPFKTTVEYAQDLCDRGPKIDEYSSEQGREGENSDSEDDCSEASQEYEHKTPQTSQDVFLLDHGTIIPRKDTDKIFYGDAIPGNILPQKRSSSPSTSAVLMSVAKTHLDDLGFGTANPEMIRTLILEDAEEAYRKATYGHTPWLGIIRERKNRYDPETRPWNSIFYPSQWRRHGLVLPEPPENSCKFRMLTLCGQILHQWYVRCEKSRAFGPREIIAKISCGEDDKCEKSRSWEPERGPLRHDNSVQYWTEIDPDEKGVDLSKAFYPFMKFWMIEGPPKGEPPPGCMKINCVTNCGLVKSRIRLLCHKHISKTPKCIGDEFTLLIDRGCGVRDDIHRCDEKAVCEGYLDWVEAKLGLPADELTPRQLDGLGKLHANLNSAYEEERKGMGSFLKHESSEKIWKDVIYNHVDMYNMLFDWGLRTIRYPKGLSVVQAPSRDIGPGVVQL